MSLFYSRNGEYPQVLPSRLRLSSGLTLTDPNTFSDQILAAEGYIKVPHPPEINSNIHKMVWTGSGWLTVPLSEEELELKKQQMWNSVLTTRQHLFELHEWRVLRYQSEVRMGRAPTDDIDQLDQYLQALRDITSQTDPFNIDWPTPPDPINVP